MDNYALPLFALVDRHKVDLNSSQLPQLAEQLQLYLEAQVGLKALDCRIEILQPTKALFVLNGVEEDSLPQLFALADAQGAPVFRYQRSASDEVTLTPLGVKPD
ncbi:MAG: hypothetical protein E1N59_2348 [Puniceicoccaceae bacterium 5H]|nr:MAG: hypothetical protein E1N59_2348 [Puniceicoccaceae bacterium 5H]